MDNLNRFADAYNPDFEYHFDSEIILNWYPERILTLYNEKNINVLELGIGRGYTCDHFSKNYNKYSVIDGSKDVIDRFKKQYPSSKANIINSFFEDFESDILYDIIIMGFVLEHVNNPIRILRHFHNFLKPTGSCFIAVPNGESLHRRIGNAAGLLPDMLMLGKGDRALGHQRQYTVNLLTEQLNECNYSIVRKEGIFLKPLMTNQLRTLNLSKEILNGMCKIGMEYPELSAALFFEAKLKNSN